jgi:hypothetical protein
VPLGFIEFAPQAHGQQHGDVIAHLKLLGNLSVLREHAIAIHQIEGLIQIRSAQPRLVEDDRLHVTQGADLRAFDIHRCLP